MVKGKGGGTGNSMSAAVASPLSPFAAATKNDSSAYSIAMATLATEDTAMSPRKVLHFALDLVRIVLTSSITSSSRKKISRSGSATVARDDNTDTGEGGQGEGKEAYSSRNGMVHRLVMAFTSFYGALPFDCYAKQACVFTMSAVFKHSQSCANLFISSPQTQQLTQTRVVDVVG